MLSFKKRWYDVIDIRRVRIPSITGPCIKLPEVTWHLCATCCIQSNVGKAAVAPPTPTSWEKWADFWNCIPIRGFPSEDLSNGNILAKMVRTIRALDCIFHCQVDTSHRLLQKTVSLLKIINQKINFSFW